MHATRIWISRIVSCCSKDTKCQLPALGGVSLLFAFCVRRSWRPFCDLPPRHCSGGARGKLGALSPQMSFSPHRETYWERIRRWIVRNFQILLLSAVRTCKQCLQTASSFAPIGASALNLSGGLSSPYLLGYSPFNPFKPSDAKWLDFKAFSAILL